MFEALKEQPVDKIMLTAQAYRADTRADKIDLGVGVYKDATGLTPVMRAVKVAEKKLWEVENTKVYTALAGEPAFADAMVGLVLGGAVPRANVAAVATPGGTGAVREAMELIKMANPNSRVFISDPSWPNHAAIVNYVGLKRMSYRYFDEASRGLDFDGLMEDLKQAGEGDVVLLHGCCHNPTGANPTEAQWEEIVAAVVASGALPMVDIAYQGFGDGLDADAFATRLVASKASECLIAASCSKNFGIYRERTGILMGVSNDAKGTKLAQGVMTALNRLNFSFPPDHGARLVTMILTDPELTAMWKEELEEVRLSMLSLRQQLADELKRLTNSDRFDFLAQHRGMFSRLGTTPELVQKLRDDHAIYMISDSRMNIAGLNTKTVPVLAAAIVKAGI